ncbi:Superoxide dismutase, copper/zinc binding domain [Pseudocohnilembus persalinus]|uniref:Superoxide dismutase [Cu-Zn] n=1 Tax=Pseudocohnilembus persalinus TaxID=266149 RepID=A0A0V0QYN1_PSEPJ|nr:Superoxide dismutase, copper/zinc binding domain [Pseudocohnilembus persalinus]|eukprot:KRX07326.1 Superoxide dismutase, copper/zinc binding domain [Pseudocohnilembus persalinus]
MLKTLALGAGLGLFMNNQAGKNVQQDSRSSTTRNAICILYPDGNSGVKGIVSFQQDNATSPTKITANVRGLKPNSLHGFHIHQYGDLTEGCTSAGPHYNPENKTHGGPLDKERHVGDLGNLKTDEKGNAYVAMSDKFISLFGEYSVVGRSCVVHAGEDDLGKGGHELSKTTGNSGGRVACGTIGLAKEFKNLAAAK